MARAKSGSVPSLTGFVAKRFFTPRFADHERLSLLTDDGVNLTGGRLAGPSDAAASIVVVHGFSHTSRTPKIHAFAQRLARRAHVLVPDLRGHGTSGGLCTLGADEPLDVAAAVAAAKVAEPDLPVVTVGISLGGAAVLLQAGRRDSGQTVGGAVAISAPAWWGAWDTPSTARIRRYASTAAGRRFMAEVLNTRVAATCPGVADSHDLVAAIAPAFTLVVHDPLDHYFGEEHAQTLFRWANRPKDLWLVPGSGHGTDLLTAELADRLLTYVEAHTGAR